MSLTLVTFKKSGERKSIKLGNGETLIGRRPECNVRIPKIEVSRNHCKIVKKDRQALIQDLGSSNGTYLNSEKIMTAVIKAGDIIAVGHILFTVQIDGQPENITQPDPDEFTNSGQSSAPALEGQKQPAAKSTHDSRQREPLVQPDLFDDSFADIAEMLMEDDDQDAPANLEN